MVLNKYLQPKCLGKTKIHRPWRRTQQGHTNKGAQFKKQFNSKKKHTKAQQSRAVSF